MKIEIFNGYWSIDDVKSNPEKIFIYGDNNARVGKGGQAIIRDLPNTIGIRTKKGPNNKPVAFYNDSEFETNCKNILEDAVKIRSLLLSGKIIVFAKDGYGTGLARLKDLAPKTYQFLVDVLRDFFEFDNNTGKIWKKTPSIDDVNNATYIDFFKSNKDLLIPINNSFFKEDCLILNLNSNYDLIKNEKKTSFTSKNKYKKGYLIMRFEGKKDYLLVKVCSDSYLCTIDKKVWSDCEGYSESFVKDIDITNYYQTQIKFMCKLSDDGQMFFKQDLFSNIDTKELNKTTVGVPVVQQKEESIDKESKLFHNPFKKSFKELLIEKEIYGEITKLPPESMKTKGDGYQVRVNDDYYYIIFYKHFFTNSIEIISVSKKPFI